MKLPEPPVLETDRCLLTLLRSDNARLLADYRQRNQAHLAPWEPATDVSTATPALRCRRAAEQAWLAFGQGTAVHFIAIDRQSQVMVAGCNFTNIVRGPLQACHLGYSVDQAHQGQGLMREVLRAGIAYMFDTQGLHRIMACHMSANIRSERLLQVLGFEREGYARAYLKIAGQWEDMVLNSLILDRWQQYPGAARQSM